jgi:predicted nucleic acid-binding Zn finger protein
MIDAVIALVERHQSAQFVYTERVFFIGKISFCVSPITIANINNQTKKGIWHILKVLSNMDNVEPVTICPRVNISRGRYSLPMMVSQGKKPCYHTGIQLKAKSRGSTIFMA